MQVLHWEFSERFTIFLEWLREITPKPVAYRYIDTHPNPAMHTRQGETEVTAGGVTVYLNREASPELAEENAAHELTHVALFEQGYAYVSLRDPYRTDWLPIVNAMQSWIADVLIDQKLLNFGYTNREYHELIYRSTMENLREYPVPSTNRIDQIGNALGYFYCHHSLGTEQWDSLRQAYREIDAPVAELGEEIIRIGEEMGFLGQNSYRRFLVAVRDHLGLGEIMSVVDPADHKVY